MLPLLGHHLFIYQAYFRGAGEAEALSFGLQALSTASKSRVYGEPLSVLPAALAGTGNTRIRGSSSTTQQVQTILVGNRPSKRDQQNDISSFFLSELKTFQTIHSVSIPGNDIKVRTFHIIPQLF